MDVSNDLFTHARTLTHTRKHFALKLMVPTKTNIARLVNQQNMPLLVAAIDLRIPGWAVSFTESNDSDPSTILT